MIFLKDKLVKLLEQCLAQWMRMMEWVFFWGGRFWYRKTSAPLFVVQKQRGNSSHDAVWKFATVYFPRFSYQTFPSGAKRISWRVEETEWSAGAGVKCEFPFNMGEYHVLQLTDESCALKADPNFIWDTKYIKIYILCAILFGIEFRCDVTMF